ncbi:MAG: choice-of-anchor B family protein [Rhodothermaceae bacterium]|nr:choice-of-anchor B family protein [Rhodothermaceae bacterium]
MNRFLPLCLLFLLPSATYAQMNAFGLSSEVAGSSIFVGHPVPDDDESGLVYVYQLSEDGDAWEVAAELMASDAKPGDAFGYSIASDGDYLAIGAPSLDSLGGAVYLFALNPETGDWQEIAKTTGTAEAPIGGAVAIAGSILATSGMVGVNPIKSVAVYTQTEEGLEHTATLAPEGASDGLLFGASVAISGNGTVCVGAPGANEGAGAVYHFVNHGGNWHGEEILSGDHESINAAALGTVVKSFGDDFVLAAGPGITPNTQPTAPPPPGKLVWARTGGDGPEILQVLDGESGGQFDLFAIGFDHSDSQLLVGTPVANAQAGGAWAFELDPETMMWTKTGEIAGGDGDVIFGLVISMSGQTAVISAPASGMGQGTVRLANLDSETGEWTTSEPLKTGKEPPPLVSSGAVDCTEGIAGQFGCNNVDLLSFMTVEDLMGTSSRSQANDVWGWVDAETDREYALVGRNDGMAFMDVSDPTNPVLKGNLPLTAGARPSNWRDVKVYADHAFIVADGAGQHGVQVFDLQRLRENTEEPVTYSEDAIYDGIASAHNIVINEDTGFAYAVGSRGGGETCGGGLHMIDIRDPLAPVFAGCFKDENTGRSGSGYTHDAQCVVYEGPDADHQGKEICFSSNVTALSISDVTNKEEPIALSSAEYPNAVYAHQGWITDDFDYFYMNDELDELRGEIVGTRTLIWDIADLDDPQLAREFVSENLATDHNLYIQGDLMYQSNYLSGLRVFDISDRINPVEVGFFDTVPHGDDEPGTDGSWSNYPFFPSGTILITSINEGLFIVRKRNIDL